MDLRVESEFDSSHDGRPADLRDNPLLEHSERPEIFDELGHQGPCCDPWRLHFEPSKEVKGVKNRGGQERRDKY